MKSLDGVLIAGAGAVGLTTALSLAQKRVPVTVLEAEPEVVREYRASTWHPPTLQMLDGLGLAEELVSKGVAADKVQYRDRRKGLIAEFDLGLLWGHTPYPYRLQVDQYAMATMALERLLKLPNATVLFRHGVTDVAVEGDHAAVTAQTEGGPVKFQVPYVVGADGGNSAVRRSLGIRFQGTTYPDRYISLFTTFDFAGHLPGFASVNYITDPEEWVIMLRSPDIWRVLFPIPPGESDEEALRDDAIDARLQGWFAADNPYPVAHSRLYKVHQRVAETYRRGPVLLAGDAAHINSPIGGMGLNGGIHDAVDLSERLARVWRGEAGGETLDAYASERRRVAIDYIQADTHRNAAIMGERDPEARKRQHDELRRTAADPALALQFVLRTSMIASLSRVPGGR